ncbi:putative membrane protein At3g27390 [Silene latifolia]|uniref:putative membrane protein At3g27390 n=1 Tax=Silene latifolia TaxID=37657 RepID=UPI003D77E77F
MSDTFERVLRIFYVVFAFCAALFLGALKGLLVGPIAALILIIGNVGVILGLFPVHVYWTFYTIIKTNRFDTPLKVAILFGLPVLAALWLSLSITASVIVGLGYGFFTPWVSTFEAFRQENEFNKFLHSIVDGTWDTVKGSCTVVRDFADLCIYSYPTYLKEIQEPGNPDEVQTLKFIHVPAIIIIGLLGLIVEVPLYTVIVIVKSPLMLIKGWQRLVHDLISREGPFLETACIPVAGLAILLWPLFVVGSVVLAIFTSVFVGLYGSVVVYQEKSFKRGLAYIVAQVAEFDEYTNDWLYLREGTILPKPRYRKKQTSHSESTVGPNRVHGDKSDSFPSEGPAMIIPGIGRSRSVKESIQDVKMVQVWGKMMDTCETKTRELIDADVITHTDLIEWLKAKNGHDAPIVGVGLPSYSFLHTLVHSNKTGANGLVLFDDVIVTHENRPQDRLFDWFFQPVLVLKEQIKMLKLEDGELRYLERVVLFGSSPQRLEAWENGCVVPQDPLRAAQIQGISRRLLGMVRSISKLPTYRRKYRHLIKELVSYIAEKEGSMKFESIRSVSSGEIV